MWLHLFCWQRATSPCISADHTDRKALLKTPESMKSLTNFRSAPSSPIFFRSPKHDTQNLIHNIEPYTSTKPIPMPYTLLTITSLSHFPIFVPVYHTYHSSHLDSNPTPPRLEPATNRRASDDPVRQLNTTPHHLRKLLLKLLTVGGDSSYYFTILTDKA